MTMTAKGYDDEGVLLPSDVEVTRESVTAVAVLNRSEVEAQLDAAHKYRRSVRAFLAEATTLATMTKDIAESCIYALPRDGKVIAGPSVRLAEIVASAYGNMHIGARVVDEDDKTVTAQGVAWDLEKNLRVTIESKRRITGKGGRRFSDDMVVVTGNAAASIALRNAIFRVVPKSYVNLVYQKARDCAVGDAKTFAARRGEVVDRLQKIGVPIERIPLRVGKPAVDDIDVSDLELLIGLGTAIKNGDAQIDEAFPPVAAAADSAPVAQVEEGRRVKLGKSKVAETVPVETATREPGDD